MHLVMSILSPRAYRRLARRQRALTCLNPARLQPKVRSLARKPWESRGRSLVSANHPTQSGAGPRQCVFAPSQARQLTVNIEFRVAGHLLSEIGGVGGWRATTRTTDSETPKRGV